MEQIYRRNWKNSAFISGETFRTGRHNLLSRDTMRSTIFQCILVHFTEEQWGT